jgi:hypothetical protein
VFLDTRGAGFDRFGFERPCPTLSHLAAARITRTKEHHL